MRATVPFRRIVELGIKSLLLHKMRSILTMLGIIFGVCSVIAMLAIGEGASYEAQQAIKQQGSANIIVRSVKPAEGSSSSGSASANRNTAIEYGITYKDVGRIQSTLPGIRRVLAARIIREDLRAGEVAFPCQIIGTHPLYQEIKNLEIVRGRFLGQIDETYMSNVGVITAGLAERLFPNTDPLTQQVKVGADYYQIVGIVRERGTERSRPQAGGGAEGAPLDSNLYIPLSTARSRFGETIIRRSAGSFQAERVQLHEVTVQMDVPELVEGAASQIGAILTKFHEKKDYEMIVPLLLLKQAEEAKRRSNIVLGSIAAISLIVGGIGIMNIMLATVTERTREIGIRRALGARKRDIVTQFLVETVVLSVGGGLIGVVLGIILPFVVSALYGMKAIITWWSPMLAFGISALVGVVFGLYPASRAAELSPIEALRRD